MADVEMTDKGKAEKQPAKVETLIDPADPLRGYFDSIPGFHTEIKVPEQKNEVKFMELRNLITTTDLLKSRYPQYDYSIEEVKARSAQRVTIVARVTTEEQKFKNKQAALLSAHQLASRNLKREQQLLTQLEQIDDNLLIIEKEIEETKKALHTKAYKEARKQRLAAAKEDRDDAYAETLALQDARRNLDVKRRKRHAPCMPVLLPDEHEQEAVDEEYDAQYAAASASA